MLRYQSELSDSTANAALSAWYAQPLGQMLAREQCARLEPVLSVLFGYHLLQVGGGCGALADGRTAIRHCVTVAAQMPADLLAAPAALPVATDMVDVVILPHTLEFDARPHQVLREVERVLIAEGHVVIVGFNPWSLWGLWRWRPWARRRVPWAGQFLSIGRLRDWLELLGFDVTHTEYFMHRPPLQRPVIMDRLQFWEKLGQRFFPRGGGAYIVVARKRVVALTPIRPRRVRPKPVLATGLARHGG